MRSPAADPLLNAPDPGAGEVPAPHRQLTEAVRRALQAQRPTGSRGSNRGGGRVTASPGSLQLVSVHPDDPVAAPLFADLAVEYDTRYGDLFGGASEELTRYPVTEFLPPSGDFVLLLAEGVPVAGGAFRRHADPGTAEVKRMWTATTHRRRGLARRVLAELERRAADRGYTRMYLTTGPRQPEARDLYLAVGWTPLFDPAVPRPTDTGALRALPVPQRLYAFHKDLAFVKTLPGDPS
jgi:GNAT superfamily N-acetyltransferase